jgi:hypothetical protein
VTIRTVGGWFTAGGGPEGVPPPPPSGLVLRVQAGTIRTTDARTTARKIGLPMVRLLFLRG